MIEYEKFQKTSQNFLNEISKDLTKVGADVLERAIFNFLLLNTLSQTQNAIMLKLYKKAVLKAASFNL